jgi:dTDP-glucose 4,6-dehydratase
MRAVVTGGAGFIGSHLCERLLADGCDVVCVDNFLTSTPRNIEHLLKHPGFRLHRRDVTHGLQLRGSVDAVFHLASPASPADYLRMPLETMRVGSAGTWHALDLAAATGARFLLASTSESYGDPQVHPQPEDYWGHVNPVGPRSVYDEAKRFGEALTMAYRRTCGVDAKIVRIFNTFGPRMRHDDGRAIPTFVRQAVQGAPITVTGSGTQTRSLCYVADVVDGLIRMLNSSHAGPVNLGNPHELSMLQLAQWIAELAGSTSGITLIPRPEDDPEKRRPEITAARELLNWEPSTPVEQGMRETISWFRRSLGGSEFDQNAVASMVIGPQSRHGLPEPEASPAAPQPGPHAH